MSRTYSWDDTYCPKGHGSWVFVPASTLYPDIYWCDKCDCFYNPICVEMSYDELNEDFSSDRASDLIQWAKFLKWRDSLSPKDMPDAPNPVTNIREKES